MDVLCSAGGAPHSTEALWRADRDHAQLTCNSSAAGSGIMAAGMASGRPHSPPRQSMASTSVFGSDETSTAAALALCARLHNPERWLGRVRGRVACIQKHSVPIPRVRTGHCNVRPCRPVGPTSHASVNATCTNTSPHDVPHIGTIASVRACLLNAVCQVMQVLRCGWRT